MESMEVDNTENSILLPSSLNEMTLDAAVVPLSYKLRLSFSNQSNSFDYINDTDKIKRWKVITQNLVDKILPYAYNRKIIGGLEFKNKLGEYTYAHIHIHFQSKVLKDTIAKPLQRYLRDVYDLQPTGAKYWCLKPDVTLRTEERFWRYPLKQGFNPRFCRGFDLDELTKMTEVAQSAYLDASQVSQSKRDKRDNQDTLFLRLMDYLDKEHAPNLSTNRQVIIAIIQFYIKEDRPVNKQVIIGYSYLYQLKKGMITPSELIDKW